MNILRISAGMALATAVTFAAQAQQVDSPDDVFYLRTITCGEVLSLPKEDAGYAMVLLFGYSAGESGENIQSGEKITHAIESAFAACEANPKMSALDAFK
jgi:hypothetical protein